MSRSGPSYRGRVLVFYPSTDWRNGSARQKVTRSNRVSVTAYSASDADDGTPTQEYDTDKGDGQLDYVISAKRRNYYECALGALIIYLLVV